jgi:hypothetical protein
MSNTLPLVGGAAGVSQTADPVRLAPEKAVTVEGYANCAIFHPRSALALVRVVRGTDLCTAEK